MKPKRRRGEAGFTLIELLIVVAILALMAGIAYPRFLRVTTPDADDLAREVARDLDLSRQEALARGQHLRVSLEELTASLPQDARAEGRGFPVTFLPTGGASGAVLTLEASDLRAVVEVDWLTGRVGWRPLDDGARR